MARFWPDVFVVSVLIYFVAGYENDEEPLAVTPSGFIRGAVLETRSGRRFHAYRGIPYAKPPVGELRFQPPVEVLEYEQEVDARNDGPACPLPAPDGYPIDEDCLVLNVYTPDTNCSQPMTVMVYIHAGGFYSFTGRSDVAGPHYFLEKDLVLVTLNYRLATLGFLSTGDEFAPGNLGLKDQVAALRWVQRNIANFGGDPHSVTISGCSSGGISVMLHMISPMSEGLFHRAIAMSGSATLKTAAPTHQKELAIRQAEVVGCPTNSTQVIFDCLKQKPWKELAYSLDSMFEFGYDPIRLWTAVVEPDFGQERFLDIDPAEAIKQGRIHAVPFIIGITKWEFFWKAFTILNNQTLMDTMNSEWHRIAPISFSLPRDGSTRTSDTLRTEYLHDKPIANDSTSATNLGRLYGDAVIGFSVHKMARLMSQHSPDKVFYYQFSYVGNHSHYEDPVTKKPTKAAHHDDLIYLFSMSYRFPTIAEGSKDDDLVQKMTSIFYNFARYGDPHPRCDDDQPELNNLRWPEMDPEERQYLLINSDFSVHQRMDEKRYRIWENLFPID